ncbi:MAG: hypothetical protein COV67_14365, partial [Nitrospinae bacterium CG11_big_fil_rev_8_21_14_0_20_56_8]
MARIGYNALKNYIFHTLPYMVMVQNTRWRSGFPGWPLFLLVWAWVLGMTLPLGATGFFRPVPVTTSPGEDFAGVVSPDGSFMVYVSDRSGNLDLWLRFLGRGLQPPDIRLTTHPAEDNSPAIGPDGKRVVFVSHRTDPRGDLYVLDLGDPRAPAAVAPTRLTEADFGEGDPAWSPNGKEVYFSAQAAGSETRSLFKIDLATRKRSPVLEGPGVNPAPSPDGRYLAYASPGGFQSIWILDLQNGNKVRITEGPFIDASPSWSPDGRALFFVRYEDDTNSDGHLTIDDNPNIWSVQVAGSKPGTLRQLTDSSTYDLLPSAHGKDLYFTSNRKSGIDVWRMDLDGIMPLEKDLGMSMEWLEDICVSPGRPSLVCLLAYHNLIAEFPQEGRLARLRYLLGKAYQDLAYFDSAERTYREILEKISDPPEYLGLAEIELLLLTLKRSQGEGREDFMRRTRQGIGQLKAIAAKYSSQSRVAARAYLEMGHLAEDLEEPSAALDFYKKVVDEFKGNRALQAQAAFSQSGIYLLVGDRESMVQAFVQVVRDFYDVTYWRQKAVREILNLFEKEETLSEKVASLQKLTLQYESLPELAAAVQNRIGDLFFEDNEFLLAKEAYRRTMERYAKVTDAGDYARFALANVYAREQNFEESLRIYRNISGDSERTQEALRQAREGWIKKTIEKGKWEIRVGETRLALKTFLRLIEFDPQTVEGHRGYIEASAALGKAADSAAFYSGRLQNHPESAVDHYGLGLAYTYFDPPRLNEARQEVVRALELDALQVFYHQTLGWIFEQKEGDEKGKGNLELALHEYQIALALNDASADPENEANLLLNLGNGNYLLSNFSTALYYYRERDRAGAKFFIPPREAIYRQRYGESAFKAGFPAESVAQFRKSLKIFTDLNERPRVAELNDRIALTYQDAGDHENAVKYFSQVLTMNREAGREASLSRTLRNIANNIYMLNQGRKTRNPEALKRALNYYFEAIDYLQKYGVASRDPEKRGLIRVELETGLSADASSAARGFDAQGEKKLIFHYVGKIYGDFAEYGLAIEYFKNKLAFIPDNLEVRENIPVLLEKALLLNQIGNYYYRAGEVEKSEPYFRDSLDLSRKLNNRFGMAVNTANLAWLVLSRCRNLPLDSQQVPIADTIKIVEEVLGRIEGPESPIEPRYSVVLRNDLGILYYYLAGTGESEGAGGGTTDLKGLVQSSLARLDRSRENLKRAGEYFEAALDRMEARRISDPDMRLALVQNRDLIRQWIGGEKRVEEPAEGQMEVPAEFPFSLRWQFKYLEAVGLTGEERQKVLFEAEELLDKLPFNLRPKDRPSLALEQALYQDIVEELFDGQKFSEALFYSEKGRQQVMVSLLPPVKLKNGERAEFFQALNQVADEIAPLAADPEADPSALDELLLVYRDELLGNMAESDPELVNLWSPVVPPLEEIQRLLRPEEVLVKLQRSRDRILVWELTSEKVLGGAIPMSPHLRDILYRVGRQGDPVSAEDLKILSDSLLAPLGEGIGATSSLLLLPDGELEFLPWAAMRLDHSPLVEKHPLTFISSLSHFKFAEEKRNLFNTMLLGVEAKAFDRMKQGFPLARNLAGEEANLEEFQRLWEHYSVVHLEPPVYLDRNNAELSHARLTRNPNRFERLQMADLFFGTFRSNFIALANVHYVFDPEMDLSPTTGILQALTFKGYPGVLMRTGPLDSRVHPVLLENFYSRFRTLNPPQALREAQMEAARQFPDSTAWAGYRYYGYPGMTEEEKNLFAEQVFEENFWAGIQKKEKKDWLGLIEYFEKAQILLDFISEDHWRQMQESKAPEERTDLKSVQREICHWLAQAAFYLGNYRKAIDYETRLARLFDAESEKKGLAVVERFIGISYSRMEQFPEALVHLKRALELFGGEASEGMAESLQQLGIVQENALNYEEALKSYFASLKAFQMLRNDEERGRQLRRIGKIYYLRFNQYKEAGEYYSRAFQLFTSTGNTKERVESMMELGAVNEKQGRFTQSLEYYRQAQALAEKNGYHAQLARALWYQANSHWFQGNYQEAFRLLKESERIAEKEKDGLQQVLNRNTLGLIYWTLNDSSRALEHLNRSLELAQELKSAPDVASAYNNIGLVYRKDEKYEKSVEFFQKALEQDIRARSRWGQGYAHRNLGMSYLRMGRLDEAARHIQQAVTLSREIENRINWVKSMLELGNLAVEKKDWKGAQVHYRETEELARELNI